MKIYKTELQTTETVYEYNIPDKIIRMKFMDVDLFKEKVEDEDSEVIDWLEQEMVSEHDCDLIKENVLETMGEKWEFDDLED